MINLNSVKKVTSRILVFFFVFILVLGMPAFIALTPIYFHHTKNTGANVLIDDADELYLNVYNFLVWQKSLSSSFTAEESSHMVDVRVLFNTFRFVSFSFLLFILIHIYLLFKTNKVTFTKIKKLYSKNFLNNFSKKDISDFKNLRSDLIILLKKFKLALIISLSFFLVLLFAILIDFSSAFNAFHLILFPQGNWIFPFNSLLITLFPASFFMSFAKTIFIISLSILITALAFAVYALNILKKKK